MNASEQKRELRSKIKRLKNEALSQQRLLRAERLAVQIIMANRHVVEARNVVCYWALADEVPTKQLINVLAKNHNVYLPVIVGDELELRRYENEESLKTESRFGICEPTSGELLEPDNQSVTIITPGIAFSSDGSRLGRGRGFYDRVFSSQKYAYKLGLAFDFQRVENLPLEPHDVKMDDVVFV